MNDAQDRIPISISLDEEMPGSDSNLISQPDKKRLLYVTSLAVLIAALITVIAKLLVYVINLITNISFHHSFSINPTSPATHQYGAWVIIIPAIGGLFVGLLALYGSKAIRGHGIPEAMEQILTNDSKIRPSITYLKPFSSAISIGTGGPFGAEGPIIATGGALGSTIGQLLKISAYERKILLASGATAGMSAIFGSPLAAIFLAIELLLFEFSPRSIIPVVLACITGAAGHHLFFEPGPVFPSPFIPFPGNTALVVYSVIGLLMGFISAGITRIVYWIEDAFEKLPVHWMWWPLIGGIAVGIIGYWAPLTLGVGYTNITELLSGNLTIAAIASLCIFKFLSWAIALGSGTSGGTLAPLMTIGGAAGALLGAVAIFLFPASGVGITSAVLVGMAAMFAGASRALLTSVVFAIETTGQSNALLPLLAACIASYVVSYLLMKNTIMTEKIARRGIATPHEYAPDILEQIKIKQVLQKAKNLVQLDPVVIQKITSKNHYKITVENNLRKAVEIMAITDQELLPVYNRTGKELEGILSYRDILAGYRMYFDGHDKSRVISLKRRTLRMIVDRKEKYRTRKMKENKIIEKQ